jgi:hypothetical protein
MPSGQRDQNNVVVLQGVHYQTGEIVPVKIDNATGHVLMLIVGATDVPPTLRTNAKHDVNTVPTMIAPMEGTGTVTAAMTCNETGYLWVTL